MTSTIRKGGAELQARDIAILRGLFEARIMTLDHIATFYFEGRREAATKRVQKLKQAGYLAERPRRAYEPSILFLTKAAFTILHERGALAGFPKIGWAKIEKRAYVSEMTLRHELAVMDVRAAFFKAVTQDPRYSIVEFSTWPLLFRFRASPGAGYREVLLSPDAFIRITEREPDGGLAEHTFFLEVDRGTEPLETLALKAACYTDFYRRGGLAARFGRPREEYKQFPFRVLMICPNAERRNNATERMVLCTPPVLTQVWLTTFAEAVEDASGAVWIQPRDYRQMVSQNEFSISAIEGVYRRRSEREIFVDQHIRKHALLSASESPPQLALTVP